MRTQAQWHLGGMAFSGAFSKRVARPGGFSGLAAAREKPLEESQHFCAHMPACLRAVCAASSLCACAHSMFKWFCMKSYQRHGIAFVS